MICLQKRRPSKKSWEAEMKLVRIAAMAAAVLAVGAATDGLTQAVAPTNSAPNPYRTIERWGEMPEGRIWGSTAGVDIDRDGSSV
jgi:hypothetical protein